MIAVYPDRESLSKAAAELFVSQFQKREAPSQRFSIVLSGGNSPRLAYEFLAMEPFRSQVDWLRVHVFWGDERCVALDDSRSNFRMANETLLSQVPIPAGQIHPIRWTNDPDAAALEYESLLRQYFENASPSFDLTFLGLGKDGHTASLFPESPALKETERWAVPVRKKGDNFDRITLALPVLNRTRMAVFLVLGEEKAEILEKVISTTETSLFLPAALIQPIEGELRWMVDSCAYRGLA